MDAPAAQMDRTLILRIEQHRALTFPSNFDEIYGLYKTSLAHNGFYFKRDYHTLKCYACEYSTDVADAASKILANHPQLCHPSWNVSPIYFGTSKKYEIGRMETFSSKDDLKARSFELASKGFYYESQYDVIKCAFCKTIVDLNSELTLLRQHEISRPQCPYLQDPSNAEIS
jgi:hypothetical protein